MTGKGRKHFGLACQTVLLLLTVLFWTSVSNAALITESNLQNNGTKLVFESTIYFDTGAEAVRLTDTDGYNDDATVFLLLESAGYAAGNRLGIYGFTTPGGVATLTGETLEVFPGAATDAPSSVTLAFDIAAGTVKNSSTGLSANIGTVFGFYFINQPGETFYSHTSLNGNGVDHFRIFDTSNHVVSNLLGSDVVIAIEDIANGGDRDYNDMIASASDLKPVPEPRTMMLLGSGLVGLAGWGRKKFRK